MSMTFSQVSRSLSGLAGVCLATLAFSAQAANSVPYADRGSYHDASYTFTAAQSGHVMAYMVGGSLRRMKTSCP